MVSCFAAAYPPSPTHKVHFCTQDALNAIQQQSVRLKANLEQKEGESRRIKAELQSAKDDSAELNKNVEHCRRLLQQAATKEQHCADELKRLRAIIAGQHVSEVDNLSATSRSTLVSFG
jgi:septal ring factor EnvC (AmiA/AmiB activator)